MSRISNIEAAILGLLYENSYYGYQLDKIIKERGMRNWTEIGFSSIYYVLNRLEKKDLIESRVQNVKGKPSRKVYTVTDDGKSAMQEKVKELLSENNKLVSPFDLGIAYIDILNSEETIKSIELYLKSTNKRIEFLENSIKMHENLNSPYNVIALFSRPLALLKAEKEWLIEFIEKIEVGE
ncbi:PadR family transcriptional regulator [Methanobacterium oryzae]|uniref:PadR family transcriptional regulator n=1 Tax=Methanobacterium oryzae TaxID=69540 RepID=UPI003D246D99